MTWLLVLLILSGCRAGKIETRYPDYLNTSVSASNARLGRVSTQPDDTRFVLVWSSSSINVRAQLFDRQGLRKIGNEIAVNTAPSETAIELRPVVTASPNGFVVAWAFQSTTRAVINCAIFASDGTKVSPPFQVSAGTWDLRPAISMLANNQGVIVWQSQYDGTIPQPVNNIYGRLFSLTTSQPIGLPFRITPSVSGQSHDAPAVAQLSQNVYVVTFALYNLVQADIYYVIYNGSTAIKVLTPLASDTMGMGFYYPTVTAITSTQGTADYFTVAWSQFSGTVQWRSINTATWEASPIFASQISTPQSATEPKITTLNQTAAIILWEASGTAFFVTVDGPGAAPSVATALVDPSKVYFPAVVALDSRYLAFASSTLTGVRQQVLLRLGKVNQPPQILGQFTVPPFKRDELISFKFPASSFSDPDGDALSFSAALRDGSSLPPWLHMDLDTSGASFTGEYAKTIKLDMNLIISDGWNNTTLGFQLYVKAPVLALPVPVQSVVFKRLFSLSLRSFYLADTLQESLVFRVDSSDGKARLPAWLSLSSNGSVTGMPLDASLVGTRFAINFVATDGDGWSNASTVEFTVRLNVPPVANRPLSQQIPGTVLRPGEPYVFVLRPDTFIDSDGDSLLLNVYVDRVGSPPPSWVIFDNTTLTLTCFPDGSLPAFTLLLVADDGLAQVTDSLEFTVAQPSRHAVSVAIVVIIAVAVVLVLALVAFVLLRRRSSRTQSARLDDGQYANSQGVATASSICDSEPQGDVAHPVHQRQPSSIPQIAHNIPMTIEDIELQQFFEREYPDLIDPISGEIMRDPVVTSAGQSYDRRCLVRHLQHRFTDPLTNQQLDRDKPFEPNHTLKKHIEQLITKWKEDRARSLRPPISGN